MTPAMYDLASVWQQHMTWWLDFGREFRAARTLAWQHQNSFNPRRCKGSFLPRASTICYFFRVTCYPTFRLVWGSTTKHADIVALMPHKSKQANKCIVQPVTLRPWAVSGGYGLNFILSCRIDNLKSFTLRIKLNLTQAGRRYSITSFDAESSSIKRFAVTSDRSVGPSGLFCSLLLERRKWFH